MLTPSKVGTHGEAGDNSWMGQTKKKRLEIPEEIFLSYIFPFPSGRESESLKTVLGVLKKAMRCAEIAALIAVFCLFLSREREKFTVWIARARSSAGVVFPADGKSLIRSGEKVSRWGAY